MKRRLGVDLIFMKKLCKAFTIIFAVALIFNSIELCAVAEPANPVFTVMSYTAVTDSGTSASTVFEDMDGLNISVKVRNDSGIVSGAVLMLGIFDGGTEKGLLKTVKAGVKEAFIPVNDRRVLTVSASEQELQTAGVTDGDRLQVYLWDDGGRITPLSRLVNAPELKIQDELPHDGIADFSATNGINGDMSAIGDIRWSRTDFYWDDIFSSNGVLNPASVKKYGDYILQAKNNGYTMLPILCYTAPWAANTTGYSYVNTNGRTIELGPVVEVNETEHRFKRLRTERNANGSVRGEPSYEWFKMGNTPAQNVEDWEYYVRTVVDIYSQAPYNVEYFQIWNEAHPAAEFYHGGLNEYMQEIHLPAAAIIKEYGCKVVYGGWPDCGAINQFINMMNVNDAWDTVDVFDIHYFDPWDIDEIYYAALKNGVKAPSMWQTEIGYTDDYDFISESFLTSFYYFMGRRSDKADQFKQFYFAWWGGGGDARTLFNSQGITLHGKSLRTLLSTLGGNDIERNTAIFTNRGLAFNVFVAQKGSNDGHSITGFRVDGKRAVLGVVSRSLVPLSVTQGMEVYFDGISGLKSVALFDQIGAPVITPEYEEMGNGRIKVTVPKDYTSRYFYITIDASAVIPPTNNIKNYELGGKSSDGTSIIAPGRWSYLKGDRTPLDKGTAAGLFGITEWAADDTSGTRVCYLDDTGSVYTDSRALSYNYTIDRWQAGRDLTVSGSFVPDGSSAKKLQVYKTADDDWYTVGAERELLFEYTGTDAANIDINIPAEDVKEGNDIYFEITTVGAYDGTAARLDVTVAAAEFRGAIATHSTNNVIDYNRTTNLVGGDRWSYLCHWDYTLNVANPVSDPAKGAPYNRPHGLMVKLNGGGGDNWYSDSGKAESWYLCPDGTMKSEPIHGGRPIIWAYTIGDIMAGKDIVIEGVVTGNSNTDLHVLKSPDTILTGDARTAIQFPLDTAPEGTDMLIGSYPKAAATDNGRIRITIPAAKAVKGNDILFWFTFNDWNVENKFNVTITAEEVGD